MYCNQVQDRLVTITTMEYNQDHGRLATITTMEYNQDQDRLSFFRVVRGNPGLVRLSRTTEDHKQATTTLVLDPTINNKQLSNRGVHSNNREIQIECTLTIVTAVAATNNLATSTTKEEVWSTTKEVV